eukprot:COSAG02_NODE_5558_length_4230_cov_5.031954_2_plen_65_part_00
MNRLESIEREIGRLVRMMHEPPPQPRTEPWAEPVMPGRSPAFRSQGANIPTSQHHTNSKWCELL